MDTYKLGHNSYFCLEPSVPPPRTQHHPFLREKQKLCPSSHFLCSKFSFFIVIIIFFNPNFLCSSRALSSTNNHAAVLQAEPFETRSHQAPAASKSQRCGRDSAQAGNLRASHQSARATETTPRSRSETARANTNHRRTERPTG